LSWCHAELFRRTRLLLRGKDPDNGTEVTARQTGAEVLRTGPPPRTRIHDLDINPTGTYVRAYSAMARAPVSQRLLCTWSKARPAVSSLPRRSATCPSSADRRRRTDCWSPNRSWSPEPGAPVGAFADAASFILRRPGEDGEVFLDGRVPAPFVFCVLDAACSELAVLYASSRDVGKRPRSLTAIPCCFAHVRTSPVVRVAIPTVCQA